MHVDESSTLPSIALSWLLRCYYCPLDLRLNLSILPISIITLFLVPWFPRDQRFHSPQYHDAIHSSFSGPLGRVRLCTFDAQAGVINPIDAKRPRVAALPQVQQSFLDGKMCFGNG